MTYFIYHIPGVKIGCTNNLERRMSDQGFTNWEILEEHQDIYIASDREIELQKQYGYGRDNKPYWQTVMMTETFSEERRTKLSIAGKGRRLSDETKAKLSAALMGSVVTEETKLKISQTLKGRYVSDETKIRMSQWQKNKPKAKVTCPYCLKTGGISNMKRYHFESCKQKKR